MPLKTQILIVDDHELVCEGLQLLLKKEPDFVVVGQALDADAAVERAAKTMPDVIIMDIDLAGDSGIEAAGRILARVPKARVIFLSAVAEAETVNQALKVGGYGYVLKSKAFGELVRAIRVVLEGHRYLCPEVSDTVLKSYQKMLDSNGNEEIVERSEKPQLSERELEVLKLTAEGLRVKEIAAKLDIGIKTVDTHRSHLMAKLGCSSAAELTRYAIREGIIKP